MLHPEIRVLLLDAMGTLVHLEAPALALGRELRERFGLDLPLATAERALAAEIAHYRARMHDARDADGVQELRRSSAEALRAALPAGQRLPEISGAELAEALVASLRFTAYPDARRALERWRQRALQLFVVSNWDSSLPDVLAQVGLLASLDGVITSAQAGAAKPDPGIFAEALARAGVEAPEAVHIGDSLEEDVAGARGLGIKALWLNRSGRQAPAAVDAIASLDEL